MFKAIRQDGDASGFTEIHPKSQWTVGGTIGWGSSFRNPGPLPAALDGCDAYPVIQRGTLATVSEDEVSALAERVGPDWLPFPTPRRRRERRFEVAEDRIWIQWWQDGDFNGLSARLINVSRHGALIVAATMFQERQPLRLTMEDPEQPFGVDGVVLGIIEGAGGMNKVRLGFLTPCPDEFFAAVADGFEAWLAGCRSR